MPWYNETAHIPLFIWDPRCRRRNERCNCLVQLIDFAPSLLEFFGVEQTRDMLGKSLKETIANNKPARDYALFGLFGAHVNITDGHYVYMRAPAGVNNHPLFEYTLMPTHLAHTFNPDELQDIQLQEPFSFTKGCKTMKIKGMPQHGSIQHQHEWETLLFDNEIDYGQKSPISDIKIERRLVENMIRLMGENDAPAEQYERLGLK